MAVMAAVATSAVAPFQRAHHVGDDPEDLQHHAFCNHQWRIRRIAGQQPHRFRLQVQLLDRHLPLQTGDYNVAMPGVQRTIHNQNVVREDTGTGHRLTFHPHKERSGWMADAQLIQIEGLFNVVLRWGGKASRDALGEQRDAPGCGYRAFDGVAKKGDAHVSLPINTVYVYSIHLWGSLAKASASLIAATRVSFRMEQPILHP